VRLLVVDWTDGGWPLTEATTSVCRHVDAALACGKAASALPTG